MSAPELAPEQVRRYARHILLPDVGGVGQRHLLASSVAVRLGASSTGQEEVALAYLCAAGVGTLLIEGAWRQPVRRADLAAGLLFGPGDVGRERLSVVVERLGAINPDVSVRARTGDEPGPIVALVAPPRAEDALLSWPADLDAGAPEAHARAVACALAVGGLRAARTLALVLETRHGQAPGHAPPECP